MNATDYLINAALVLLVLRQVRETRLTWQILLLPVLIVIGAACLLPAVGPHRRQ